MVSGVSIFAVENSFDTSGADDTIVDVHLCQYVRHAAASRFILVHALSNTI